MLIFFNVTAQENLILNGDFEEYWECPDALTQIERCKYVYNPCYHEQVLGQVIWSTTSDYFNACSSSFDCSVPTNTFCYQQPRSGDGYVGLCHSVSISDYKEYVQLSFNSELMAFATYRFTIYSSISDATGWSTDFMQFKFTNSLEYFNTYISEVMTPDITLSDLNITDSTKWVELSFDYVARGGEKYLIFGNFNTYSNNDCFYVFDGTNPLLSTKYEGYAYFLFDDASFVLVKEAEPITFPNVLTPNDDGLNDIFTLFSGSEHAESITILNRWGNKVYESSNNFTWDGLDQSHKKLTEGIYFVNVVSKIEKEGKKENYHGMVHLIR